MHEEVARVLAAWWRRETRGLAVAAALMGLFQCGLVLLTVFGGVLVLGGLGFFGYTAVDAVDLLPNSPAAQPDYPFAPGRSGWHYLNFSYLAFAVVTCAAYPFFRQAKKGYLIAAPGLADGVALPSSLVGERKDAFEDEGPVSRLWMFMRLVFSLPIALERAFTAWREAVALFRPRADECGAVLAELFLHVRPVPFATLAQRVPCDWQKTLPRLAQVPGLLFYPSRKDAFGLGEDMRLRIAEALEADGVVFEVAE